MLFLLILRLLLQFITFFRHISHHNWCVLYDIFYSFQTLKCVLLSHRNVICYFVLRYFQGGYRSIFSIPIFFVHIDVYFILLFFSFNYFLLIIFLFSERCLLHFFSICIHIFTPYFFLFSDRYLLYIFEVLHQHLDCDITWTYIGISCTRSSGELTFLILSYHMNVYPIWFNWAFTW